MSNSFGIESGNCAESIGLIKRLQNSLFDRFLDGSIIIRFARCFSIWYCIFVIVNYKNYTFQEKVT